MPQSVQQFDVAVVGAGPAGATAAHALASRGMNVVIIEKAKLPRYKTCGGGLLPKTLELLDSNLSSVIEHESFSAQFRLSERLRFRVSRTQPIITMTMREKLDQLLVERAVHAGAKLRSPCNVLDLTIEENTVAIKTNLETIRAQFVIAADGANSTVAKKTGWPDHKNNVPALEYEVFVKDEDFARLSNESRFDFDVVPRGYAWVFPKQKHLSIGVLTTRSTGVNLRQCLENYLRLLGISRPISIERHGFVIPLQPRSSTLAANRIILTGDAAGLADPITAEGISAAIQSARFAADAIVRGQLQNDRVCSIYNHAIRSQIFPQLKWARRLAVLMYDLPRLRNFLFRLHGQRLTEVMTELIRGQTTYTSLMRNPINYLKLLKKIYPRQDSNL